MLFDPLLLRTDQQEIKDDENQDQRQERHYIKAAADAASRLGISR